VLSILMLVAGAILQATASRTALAERITQLKTAPAVQESGMMLITPMTKPA